MKAAMLLKRSLPSWRKKRKPNQGSLDPVEERNGTSVTTAWLEEGNYSGGINNGSEESQEEKYSPAKRQKSSFASISPRRALRQFTSSHNSYPHQTFHQIARKIHPKKQKRSERWTAKDPFSLEFNSRKDLGSFSSSLSCASSDDDDSMKRLISSPEQEQREDKPAWLPGSKKRRKSMSTERVGLLFSTRRLGAGIKGFNIEEIVGTGERATDLQEEYRDDEEVPLWIMQYGREILSSNRQSRDNPPDDSRDESIATVTLSTSSHEYEPPPAAPDPELEEEELIPLVVQEPLLPDAPAELPSTSEQPVKIKLAAKRSLHDRLKEQRVMKHRNRLRRAARSTGQATVIRNLSTVDELPSEEERTDGSKSSKSTLPSKAKKKAAGEGGPPIDVVSYDSSLGESHSVAAVDDDDELSLTEEFVAMPDGTLAQIIVEMEI